AGRADGGRCPFCAFGSVVMNVTGFRPSAITEAFRPLFEPAAIAVAGASASGTSAGNRFIRVLKETGYAGRIMPIHPHAAQIEDLPAFPSLAAMPEIADYAYLTVPASSAESLLADAAGRVRFAQVMASGDPETH